MTDEDFEDKKVQHLNVFLVKPQYSTSDEVIDKSECRPGVSIPIAGYGTAELFIKRTPAAPPRWAALFKDFLDIRKLAVQGTSGALFIEVKGRCFVLALGQGGRFLLKDDVAEDRFGLLCALNAVDPNTFRCVDVQALDAIQSHTRIQSGQEATPDQFGLDVEQDMLKTIVGAPKNPALGGRITGSDSLSISVKVDLSDLPFVLDECRKHFEADLSKEDHQWVYNIAQTKSPALTTRLEHALNDKFASGVFDGIWLSVPEILDWTAVKGFMYARGKREIHADISLPAFLRTMKGETVTVDVLRSRRVMCADADHKELKGWPVFKCLYAEIDLDERKYILNDGKWFSVETDFVARTDAAFATIPTCALTLPPYCGGGEGVYNESVAAASLGCLVLLDAKTIPHGGGHGKIEVCDLLSIDKHLVHVKIYGKSSVLSHLFAQGFVSGQLIQIDPEFRGKVRDKLTPPYSEFFRIDQKPAPEEFTIVYAVISDTSGEELRLPFFSKVNLVNTRKILRGYGFKVEILKIPVDETFAKTTYLPPRKT